MPVTIQAMDVAGTSRRFLLAEPVHPPSTVVLCLHGTRSSAEDQLRLSRMDSLAAGAGAAGAVGDCAAVAFPEGIVPMGSGFRWDPAVDVPFLARLAEALIERYRPVGGRVVMAGMSGGARMSCWFAADRTDLVSCVGAVAGLRASGDRAPSRPVPIVAFHGTGDRINPYAGGRTARWDESVRSSAERWAEANRLPQQPSEVALSPTLTRTTWGEAGQPGEVTLYTFARAGHTWPGTRLRLFLRLLLGRTSFEMDATEEIWNFARRHAGDP